MKEDSIQMNKKAEKRFLQLIYSRNELSTHLYLKETPMPPELVLIPLKSLELQTIWSISFTYFLNILSLVVIVILGNLHAPSLMLLVDIY